MKKQALFFLLILFLMSFDAAMATELRLRDGIVTENTKVYLKDILSLNESQMDESFRALIEEVYICQSPQVGSKRQVDSGLIMMRLQQKGIDVSKIRFRGNKNMDIQRKEGVLTVQSQLDMLQKWIAGQLGLEINDFSLQMKEHMEDLIVPFGQVGLLFKGKKETLLSSKPGIVMEVYVDGEFFKRVGLAFQVLMKRDVVVLKQDIPKGTVVKAEYLQIEKRLVPLSDKELLTDFQSIKGGVAKKDFMEDEILRIGDVNLRNLVSRGDYINCDIQEKNMQIKIKLKVLEHGDKGEVVKLANVETEKVVLGKVIGKDEVEVLL